MNRDIKAKDIKTLLLKVYRRYQGGVLTEAQASKETSLLNSILKSIEATEIEKRLDKVEGKLFEVRIIDSTSTNG